MVRLFCMKCRGRHTKVLVRGVIANKICAFGGLLCHERNDSSVRLDFLERFGLFHKGIDVVHDFDQVNNAVVAVHLSQDGLRKCQIRNAYNIRKTCLVCGGQDAPRHRRIRVHQENSWPT
jgi:hypothetical protein